MALTVPSTPVRAMMAACLIAMFATSCVTGGAARTAVFHVQKDCARTALCFATVQSALDATAAIDGAQPVSIRIGAGDFNEKVTVNRANVDISGQGVAATRIYFDISAEQAKAYHRNGWGTPGSATLTVNATRVTVRDVTIENSFDYLSNDALADDDPAKIANSQAVAVLLDVDSDHVLFERTAMLGFQDTLFANGGRGIIRDSLIAGNIDFIFGNGQLLVENSEIRTRRRAANRSDGEFHSFIAAPSTQLRDAVGLVFYRSRLTREDGVPDNSVALARPWHPTTRFADGRYADPDAVGQAVFIDCVLGEHIHPAYWASMPGTARDGTKTAIFKPEDSRFAETGSTGPGVSTAAVPITWRAVMDITAIRAVMLAD